MRPTPLQLAVAGTCLLAAGVSLALPYSLSGDEWSWVIWGREVLHLDLALAGGTAWKPLPVLFTAPLALLGDPAPDAWLLVARASWLLALVAAYRLGARLAGVGAGLLAAGALLLIPAYGSWLGLVLRGGAEPMVVALTLWAIDRHVNGHRLEALALGCLAALGRPEPWPLVVVYAAFVWRQERGPRRALAPLLVAVVPALWLGGGLWGAGDPLAAVNQVGTAVTARDKPAAPRPGGPTVVLPILVAAFGACLRAWWRIVRGGDDDRDALTLAIAAAAVGWLLVVLLGAAVLGLPVVSRFLMGPAALASVLGAAGIALAVRAVHGWPRRAALAVAIAAASAPFVAARAGQLPAQLGAGAAPARSDGAWAAALESARGRERVAGCGDDAQARNVGGRHRRMEVAWRLGLPMARVHRMSERGSADIRRALVLVPATVPGLPPPGHAARSPADAKQPGRWRRTGAARGWVVYEVGCRAR